MRTYVHLSSTLPSRHAMFSQLESMLFQRYDVESTLSQACVPIGYLPLSTLYVLGGPLQFCGNSDPV